MQAVSQNEAKQIAWYQLLLVAAIGTGLSVVVQGFFLGKTNNVYHIPIVLKLFDSPQFANDPFYQSLRNFTSLVWPGLSMITTPGNIRAVFFGAHLASRFFLYGACLVFLYIAGLRTIFSVMTATLVLAFSRAFVDYSAVGDMGMQIDYFTHTELTYPLIVASLLLAANRWYTLAFVLNGLTLNVNAFIGVWMAAVLPLVTLANSRDLVRGVRRIAAGTVVQLLVALPAFWWIWNTLDSSKDVPAFDYVGFLKLFYPKHFLIGASTSGEIFQFAMTCVSGGLALQLLGTAFRAWKVAFYGLIAVFGVGVVLPFVSGSRLLLDLHLLRIDGVIALFSTLFVILVALGIDAREPASSNAARGFVMLATLCIGNWGLTAIALGLLLHYQPTAKRISAKLAAAGFATAVFLTAASQTATAPWSLTGCLIVAAMCLGISFLAHDVVLGTLALVVASLNFPWLCIVAGVCFAAAILWKERATYFIAGIAVGGALIQAGFSHLERKPFASAALMVLGAVILLLERHGPNLTALRRVRLPRFATALLFISLLWCAEQRAKNAWTPNLTVIEWEEAQRWARLNTPEDSEFLVPPRLVDGFQLGSYRKVWTDFRQGGAVLWSPSFYARWISRFPAVDALKSHGDYHNYARAHGLHYYVFRVKPSHHGMVCPDERRLYENAEFEIYRLNPEEPGQPPRGPGDVACSD